ncbi:MAG: ribonuclease HII [Candidatus Micrarchaeota archaeon]|nr:MAG: ribonuclease HII [Candidatus Micrarchaeota archaeon]
MLIAGFDEAGRGAIFGPLVIGFVAFYESDLDYLESNSIIRDSKTLSPRSREIANSMIISRASIYDFVEISPSTIDNAIKRRYSLNQLEADFIANYILRFNQFVDKFIIDSPDTEERSFSRRILNILNKLDVKISEDKIIAKHFADRDFKVVSAASIVAKVNRDFIIESIKSRYKVDIGSGYPSDPKAIEALKSKKDLLKRFIRKEWYTYKRIEDEKQKKLF